MYGETFYGRHTAQHQLQWSQIKFRKLCLPDYSGCVVCLSSQDVKTIEFIHVHLPQTALNTNPFGKSRYLFFDSAGVKACHDASNS